MSIKKELNQAVIAAMKAKEKDRLKTLRMATAAIKQIEVDERIEVDDTRTLAIIDKLIKQRKDAAQQFKDANRKDLMEQELSEITVLQEFMPQPLSEDEIASLIDSAMNETGADSMKDMGKVMGIVSKKLAGQADGKTISTIVKQKLSS